MRMAAGLSGVEVAARAGVPQPTVSRVETGRRVSDPEIVMRIITALRADRVTARRLGDQVRQAYASSEPRRVDAGVSFRPTSAEECRARARVIRDFQGAVIPAVLQTAAYAEAANLPGGAPGHAAVLDDATKTFAFVLTEAALSTWPGTGEFMPDQFAYLTAAAGRPNVRLGVVPARAAASFLLPVPLHGFTVYDDRAVTVVTFTRTLTLTRADEVAVYADAFDHLAGAASYGQDAQALVRRAADEFRDVWAAIH